jgi:DNA-binding MarR family transcriptional regulator
MTMNTGAIIATAALIGLTAMLLLGSTSGQAAAGIAVGCDRTTYHRLDHVTITARIAGTPVAENTSVVFEVARNSTREVMLFETNSTGTGSSTSIVFQVPGNQTPGTYIVLVSARPGNTTLTNSTDFDITDLPAGTNSSSILLPVILLGLLLLGAAAASIAYLTTEAGRFDAYRFLLVMRGRPEREKKLKDSQTRWMIIGLLHERGKMYFTDIVDELDLAAGTATHHLLALEKAGLIVSRRSGFRREFEFEKIHEDARKILASLEIGVRSGEGDAAPVGMTRAEISETSGLSPKLVEVNLGEMIEKGFVVKEGSRYLLPKNLPLIWKSPFEPDQMAREPDISGADRLRSELDELGRELQKRRDSGQDIEELDELFVLANHRLESGKLEKTSNSIATLRARMGQAPATTADAAEPARENGTSTMWNDPGRTAPTGTGALTTRVVCPICSAGVDGKDAFGSKCGAALHRRCLREKGACPSCKRLYRVKQETGKTEMPEAATSLRKTQ